MRRVEVPLTIRLDRLHLGLQVAMGRTNSHLHEIRARDVRWGRPDLLLCAIGVQPIAPGPRCSALASASDRLHQPCAIAADHGDAQSLIPVRDPSACC
ncbi:MAG TPA: hypothetical protein VIZ17_20775 [Acetobacteraceae bacterium]